DGLRLLRKYRAKGRFPGPGSKFDGGLKTQGGPKADERIERDTCIVIVEHPRDLRPARSHASRKFRGRNPANTHFISRGVSDPALERAHVDFVKLSKLVKECVQGAGGEFSHVDFRRSRISRRSVGDVF